MFGCTKKTRSGCHLLECKGEKCGFHCMWTCLTRASLFSNREPEMKIEDVCSNCRRDWELLTKRPFSTLLQN